MGELVPVLVWLLAVALVIVGFAGLVIPGLPGAPLLFAGLLVAAWAEDFRYVGWGTLVVLALLGAATWLADFAASVFGVRRAGASVADASSARNSTACPALSATSTS